MLPCLEYSFSPPQVFADLADVRLDKRHLSAPIDRNEEPDAAGSFGVVVKRFFHEVMMVSLKSLNLVGSSTSCSQHHFNHEDYLGRLVKGSGQHAFGIVPCTPVPNNMQGLLNTCNSLVRFLADCIRFS